MLEVEEHEIIDKIRKEIHSQEDSIHSFCKKKKFRYATIHDFLNKKASIRASMLFRVLDSLGMTVIKIE